MEVEAVLRRYDPSLIAKEQGRKVHLNGSQGQAHCSGRWNLVTSNDRDKVTCKNCLRYIARLERLLQTVQEAFARQQGVTP